jgi:hypothetical protein
LDKIDIAHLAVSAKKRLDEAFPEEEGSVADQAEKKQSLIYALSKLKPLASALEWKVPPAALREYLRELAHVRSAFSDDREALILIRVQQRVCRRLDTAPPAGRPALLALLRRSFSALEALIAVPETSPRRVRLVRQILAGPAGAGAPGPRGRAPFGDAPGPPATGAAPSRRPGRAGRGPSAAAPLENRTYYLVPANQMDELKTFIRGEMERFQNRILAAFRARRPQRDRPPETR